MRCLTLANALHDNGAEIIFVCRHHIGNLFSLIKSSNHTLLPLPSSNLSSTGRLTHAHFLGATQQDDAHQTIAAMKSIGRVDYLIVDHYSLDVEWEAAMRGYAERILVIDDLADRRHECEVLLDQTYGRDEKDYQTLVSEGCTILCGSQYALLRPEFSVLRKSSLKRREKPQFRQLLISLGGIDSKNATGQILRKLKDCPLPTNCKIIVVVGSSAPYLVDVKLQASQMPWLTDVMVGVNNMAQLMVESDLAIGAAGSTTWERCCLGLPTIMLSLADNQKMVALNLQRGNAVILLNTDFDDIQSKLSNAFSSIRDLNVLRNLSIKSASICDGLGVNKVSAVIN